MKYFFPLRNAVLCIYILLVIRWRIKKIDLIYILINEN